MNWATGLAHAIDAYRMRLLPALEELDGFCSTSPDGRPRERSRRLHGNLRQP
jgi:hypothetical protein